MVRIRTLWLVAVVGLGLGAGACSGKKKEENKARIDTATTTAGAVAVGDDLALLPADSELVLGLDFAQLQQSALWKQFAPALKRLAPAEMAKASEELNDFKTACGFDPVEAVKSISMGAKGDDDTREGIVVVHGPDKAKVMDCLPKAKEQAAKSGIEITVDGDVFHIKPSSGEQSVWTFVGNDTIVGAIGPSSSKETLLATLKGASGLKSSPRFLEIYSKINTKDSLWMFVNGNTKFVAQASPDGVKPKAVYGSLNITDGLALDVRIRLASVDEVNKLIALANSHMGSELGKQVKQMFDKLEIGPDGNDVELSLAMSQENLMYEVNSFIDMFLFGVAGTP